MVNIYEVTLFLLFFLGDAFGAAATVVLGATGAMISGAAGAVVYGSCKSAFWNCMSNIPHRLPENYSTQIMHV